MCMLYEEHRSAEMEGKIRRCHKCKKFPSNEGKQCYHCFAVGHTIDECPECFGKHCSEEFLEVKAKFDRKYPKTIQ